jgi:hypothetical protein
MTLSSIQKLARSRMASIHEPASRCAATPKRSPTGWRRPNALTMRMPTADSSTTVARSPCWSWTRRETSWYRRVQRLEIQAIGSVEASTTSPSGTNGLTGSAVRQTRGPVAADG